MGKTFAEAAAHLGRQRKKFEDDLNSSDRATRNTAERMLTNIDARTNELFSLQEEKKEMESPMMPSAGLPVAAYGDEIEDRDGIYYRGAGDVGNKKWRTENAIMTGASILPSIGNYFNQRAALKNVQDPREPVKLNRITLDKTMDVSADMQDIRRGQRVLEVSADRNLSSAQTGQAAKTSAYVKGLLAKNKLRQQQTNYRMQVGNQEAALNSRVDEQNARALNSYYSSLTQHGNALNAAKSNTVGDLMTNLSLTARDYISNSSDMEKAKITANSFGRGSQTNPSAGNPAGANAEANLYTSPLESIGTPGRELPQPNLEPRVVEQPIYSQGETNPMQVAGSEISSQELTERRRRDANPVPGVLASRGTGPIPTTGREAPATLTNDRIPELYPDPNKTKAQMLQPLLDAGLTPAQAEERYQAFKKRMVSELDQTTAGVEQHLEEATTTEPIYDFENSQIESDTLEAFKPLQGVDYSMDDRLEDGNADCSSGVCKVLGIDAKGVSSEGLYTSDHMTDRQTLTGMSDIKTLDDGDVLFLDTGDKGWDSGRDYGIDHTAIIVVDAKTGSKYVAEVSANEENESAAALIPIDTYIARYEGIPNVYTAKKKS